MSQIIVKDGSTLFYRAWGDGRPIVFSHDWPLSGDAWDCQMLFFGEHGYRVVAHDRRGHGRSRDTLSVSSMDQYADDLADLIEELDLRDVILVGHSTGGGEAVRYLGRHSSARVAKLVLLSAVPPLMLQTPEHPAGLPIAVFDALRKGVRDNRAQFFRDLATPFYGFNRAGRPTSDGLRDSFWLQGMGVSIKAAYDCIAQFSETDFTADLKMIRVPTLILHGDDDQIVPITASALLAAPLVRDSRLLIYPGGSHGIAQVEQDRFNADLLAFINS